VSPKIGATYDVASWLGLYASYRHGFRAPSQSQLFQQNSAANTVGLSPVRANSYEVGLRGELSARAAYAVSAYDMRINDDIITYVTTLNTREATNAGETRHRGVEGSLGLVVLPVLRADVSYSVSRQRYVNWTPQSGVSYSGDLIEQAPSHLGDLLLSYSPAVLRGGRAALEWVEVGRYELDPQNTHQYGGYRVVNAHLNYQILSTAELFTRVVNLTNRNYAELASYDPFQLAQYSPGNPRTVYAGVRYRLVK
jgi:outer membrane receptor protein involved in Fe transport